MNEEQRKRWSVLVRASARARDLLALLDELDRAKDKWAEDEWESVYGLCHQLDNKIEELKNRK